MKSEVLITGIVTAGVVMVVGFMAQCTVQQGKLCTERWKAHPIGTVDDCSSP